jgi:hypothetical protein
LVPLDVYYFLYHFPQIKGLHHFRENPGINTGVIKHTGNQMLQYFRRGLKNVEDFLEVFQAVSKSFSNLELLKLPHEFFWILVITIF